MKFSVRAYTCKFFSSFATIIFKKIFSPPTSSKGRFNNLNFSISKSIFDLRKLSKPLRSRSSQVAPIETFGEFDGSGWELFGVEVDLGLFLLNSAQIFFQPGNFLPKVVKILQVLFLGVPTV